MALVKTKGIVIREQPFQEQDKILTLFTEEEGKVKAIAKGVRRNRSPLVAATQLFAYSEFVYYPGKNFANINQASLIQSFYPLRNDLIKMSLASYVLELLDAFYDYYQGNKAVLRLVNFILFYISEDKSQSNEALVAALQLKLTEVHGIRPVFDNNGDLCENCHRTEGYSYRLTPEVITEMVYLLVTPIKAIRQRVFDKTLVRRIMDMMNHYISYQLAKNLKTYDFYRDLNL